MERVGQLVESARTILKTAGVNNVSLLSGDGTLGWRDYAPYDAILVSAGSPQVPAPLAEQLAEGGRMLSPLGTKDEQILTVVTRRGAVFERRDIGPVRFVPLVGAHGWPAN
jgi:protein-L-isoaspartate(D-aspartate) O-methyltransferase